MAAGVATASLATAGPAAAQDADGRGGSAVLRSVSLAQANRLVTAALQHVRDAGLPPMFVQVVDVCGDEKAAKRMDGNGLASLALVPAEARTAISFRTATADLARTTDPARIASLTTAGFSLLGGGRPVVEDGTVIGAIAVGGGSPEQDDEVARAALAAL